MYSSVAAQFVLNTSKVRFEFSSPFRIFVQIFAIERNIAFQFLNSVFDTPRTPA